MGVFGANMLDKCPEGAGIGGAIMPTGKIGAAVGKGERGAEVETDKGVGGKVG